MNAGRILCGHTSYIGKGLFESEGIEAINNIDKFPNMEVRIPGVETEALVNTGSEITYVFKNFS